MKHKILLTTSVSVFVLSLLLLLLSEKPQSADASVQLANEYHATSTGSVGAMPAISTIFTGTGSLGSVIVTEAGSSGSHINIYDATTTNKNLRTNQAATSTILIASLPNNLTVGTYTFDTVIQNGLTFVFDGSGAQATSTITYR